MLFRKGQGWTMDYMVSILIFIIAGILAVELLVNTFPQNDFNEIKREAISISDSLLKEGSPKYWQAANVLRIGIISSKNRIKEQKIENLMEMDYKDTKRKLGLKHDYAFYFVDDNDTIISIGSECAFGSTEVTQNKNFYNELLPSAYYFYTESNMNAYMTSYGSDFYDGTVDNDVDLFYSNLDNYRFVLMEIPQINLGGSLTTQEKIEAIESFVNNGGILFLSETVGVNMTGVTFSSIPESPNADIQNEADPYFELTNGLNIVGDTPADPSFTTTDISTLNYTMMADYLVSNSDFMTKWRFGLGKVYYLPTIDATYGGATPFEVKIDEAVQKIVNSTRANCTSLGNITAGNIAKVERLVVLDSKINKMVVLSWT